MFYIYVFSAFWLQFSTAWKTKGESESVQNSHTTNFLLLLCLPTPSLSLSVCLNTIFQLTNSDPTEPVAELCFTQMTISISYYL